jgi:hypothetical protein
LEASVVPAGRPKFARAHDILPVRLGGDILKMASTKDLVLRYRYYL